MRNLVIAMLVALGCAGCASETAKPSFKRPDFSKPRPTRSAAPLASSNVTLVTSSGLGRHVEGIVFRIHEGRSEFLMIDRKLYVVEDIVISSSSTTARKAGR